MYQVFKQQEIPHICPLLKSENLSNVKKLHLAAGQSNSQPVPSVKPVIAAELVLTHNKTIDAQNINKY